MVKRNDTERPDTQIVQEGLKDFQCNTVNYVFDRLYNSDGSGRFLVADEVGLGKTLVARGVIAKTIDHLWEEMDGEEPLRIDVIYICSNADIAKQNIARLHIPGYPHASLATRITMLPIRISNLRNNRLNFVSFTPGTSFNLRSAMGRGEERALLYHMLKPIWSLSGTGPLNVLRGYKDKDNFRKLVRESRKWSIDPAINEEYESALNRHMDEEIIEGKSTLRQRFDDLCIRFKRARKHIPRKDRSDQRRIIGELREILAVACITSLEPDLIILDEFQRFRNLLEGTDQAGGLARELFLYPDARLLLLSATPYKMYTLADEASVDDHYKDFLRTVDFLFQDQEKSDELRGTLEDYRRELYRLGEEGEQDRETLLRSKEKLEGLLKQVIVRTEKLSSSMDQQGMLVESVECKNCLKPTDLTSYVGLQQTAQILEQFNTLEYWKSAPYLLNFMDRYQLKRRLVRALEFEDQRTNIAKQLSEYGSVLLDRKSVEKYKEVDPNNARLRYLLEDTVNAGGWRLLWMPPSLPYYELGGPFADVSPETMTKRLVFSSWHVVPKSVSVMLSYFAERKMVMYESEPLNTPEGRKKRSRLLEFTLEKDGDRLRGMPVFTLLYPSPTLAEQFDPLQAYIGLGLDELPTCEEVLLHTVKKAEGLLARLPVGEGVDGRVDQAWYWAAPILLDLNYHRQTTRDWWFDPQLIEGWRSGEVKDEDLDDDGKVGKGWAEHVEQVRRLLDGKIELGRKPDDLAEVMTVMALASPGTCALRSLARISGQYDDLTDSDLRLSAASIGWAFRSLFNVPEVIALIRGFNAEEPYWRRVLEYCRDGCLQSVMDEYAHVLRDSLGLFNKSGKEVAAKASSVMRSAIQLHRASLGVDDIVVEPNGEEFSLEDDRFPRYRLRTHFALRFGDIRTDTDKTLARKEGVREAFNSPFWPFVLVTTSVGQEGLDFHWYCHAVIHWNLPPNPVDLEQREGRVHRYKGHAIRKNIAHDFREEPFPELLPDPWENLFMKYNQDSESDMIPFWIYPADRPGVAQIERHVPAIPLSREITRLHSLKKALTVYRMVFGQNRQDDLVEYLLGRIPEDEVTQTVLQTQVNLEPPHFSDCE